MGIGKTLGVGLLTGLAGGAIQYGAAALYEKAASGITTRNKVIGLAVTQVVLGAVLGGVTYAARRPLTEGIALPAAATFAAMGINTGLGLVILAAKMPASLPAAPAPSPELSP